MKKLLITLATVAVALTCSPDSTFAQAPAAAPGEYKVGLIDMAHVFKKYAKFEALRNSLKSEIERSDQQAKAMAQSIKSVQDRLKTFREGSPEYLTTEKELAKQASEFEAFRKVAQRDFLRKEADIYKTVYLEVGDAVKLYAEHFKYSLVIRFNREELEDNGNPQAILQSMNRQVVYLKPEYDITEQVLQYLNRKYQQAAGAPPARN